MFPQFLQIALIFEFAKKFIIISIITKTISAIVIVVIVSVCKLLLIICLNFAKQVIKTTIIETILKNCKHKFLWVSWINDNSVLPHIGQIIGLILFDLFYYVL